MDGDTLSQFKHLGVGVGICVIGLAVIGVCVGIGVGCVGGFVGLAEGEIDNEKSN